MTGPGTVAGSQRAERKVSAHRRLACGAMTLAATGLVIAVLLGAPLISVLLAGVLLLCPLLLWAPLRYHDRSLDALDRGTGGDD